jgi:hypothetical protein
VSAGIVPLEPQHDLLNLSAPLARAWARSLCRHIDRNGGSCASSHGLRQDLRRLNLVTSPWDHAEFYHRALGPLIRSGIRRVLVSGTADYALPAILLQAFASELAEASLTVLDVCETPLRLCAWYAAHIGAKLSTECSDILAYHSERPFDLICSDSFFGVFPPPERSLLVKRWYDLLIPAGRVVTVNRIRPDAPETVRFTAEQARAFREQVRRAAARRATKLNVVPDELAALAQSYAATRVIYPVHSTDELIRLFEANGFRIDSFTVGPMDVLGSNRQRGPTLRDGADYARFVAFRL